MPYKIKPGRENPRGAKSVRQARQRTQIAAQAREASATTGHYKDSLPPYSGPVPSTRTCQFTLWPHGKGPDHPDFGKMCGKRTFKRSYCEEHYNICWRHDHYIGRSHPAYRKDK